MFLALGYFSNVQPIDLLKGAETSSLLASIIGVLYHVIEYAQKKRIASQGMNEILDAFSLLASLVLGIMIWMSIQKAEMTLDMSQALLAALSNLSFYLFSLAQVSMIWLATSKGFIKSGSELKALRESTFI
mmetsp:Transcript_34633/g.60905  ORF Transcript_34633/g.60905 Transcript_34633/m.60905 type:complete len:131 (+) Transcript_34633:347-739(+)